MKNIDIEVKRKSEIDSIISKIIFLLNNIDKLPALSEMQQQREKHTSEVAAAIRQVIRSDHSQVIETDHSQVIETDHMKVTLSLAKDKENCSVYTTESHLYPALLTTALKKAADFFSVSLSDDQVMRFVDDYTKHEFSHSIPALGHPSVTKIKYGISFFRDDINGGILLEPFIAIDDKISFDLARQVIGNPGNDGNLSKKDKDDLKTLDI